MIAFQATHLSIQALDPLFGAFRSFGVQGNAIAEQYDDDDKLVEIEEVGASYDSGHWIALSEWSHSNTHSFLGEQTAWYISGGYRLARFTPYLTFSHVTAIANSSPGSSLANLDAASAGFASGLNDALSSLLQEIADQQTEAVGVRWDLVPHIDFKVQLDHTRLGAGSSGTLTNIQPGFQTGGRFNLISITMDFVY